MDRRGFLRAGALASVATATGTPSSSQRNSLSVLLSSHRHLATDGSLRLNANENPMGLSAEAREAVIESISLSNRYPDSWEKDLYPAIASKIGVRADNVFTGAGSSEVIQAAIQALASPNMPLIMAEPTFEDATRYSANHGYDLIKIPLDSRYAHDLERMRDETERTPRPSVGYICNPNNPTATLTSSSEIDSWIQDAPQSVFFIIDEAYYELVEDPGYWSAIKWIDERPNVLVTRTFSKIYGMAGLRLGYGVAHPATVQRFKAFISQSSRNMMGIQAGIASLKTDGHVERTIVMNNQSRKITQETLDNLDLEYLPSHTNFLMHKINGDLELYIRRFYMNGINVGRAFPPMMGYNRISFGLPEEMERWADTLHSFRSKGWV
jgi:histidinol-phosphate aminotransferase